jgi:hypothetical protein
MKWHIYAPRGKADKERPTSRSNLAYEYRNFLQSAQSLWKRQRWKTKKEVERGSRKRYRVYQLCCFSSVKMILLILQNEMLISSTRSYLARSSTEIMGLKGSWSRDVWQCYVMLCCLRHGWISWQATYRAVFLEAWAEVPVKEPTVLSCSRHGPILPVRNPPCFVARDLGGSPGKQPTVLCFSRHGPKFLWRNPPCCVARDMGRSYR